MTHHIALDEIHLFKGAHNTRLEGVCLLEAVAWWADEEHTDRPARVSPVLGSFGRNLNDVLPDDKRQQLVPYIPAMVDTANDGQDEARGYLALDWLIRNWTPPWLDLAGLNTHAAALRNLEQITDLGTARLAGLVVRAADAAGDAAGAAAWDAAGAAAGDAAWAAAWDAARAAAGDAAGDAARAAAGDAAWAAAWDAARAAAWDAAGDAARAAAWDAARAAARDFLAPTVSQLQDSAIVLFGAMIKPAENKAGKAS